MTDWRITEGTELDLTVSSNDIETDDGLDQAVLISVFCDARAGAGDIIPNGETDRRGYWGDEFIETGSIGSKLWLLDREPNNAMTARRAEQFIEEALAWMVTEKVASSVSAQVTPDGNVRNLLVKIVRPDGSEAAVRYRYGKNWVEKQKRNGLS